MGRHWLDFPLVTAPGAARKETCKFAISPTFITKLSGNRRCTPIFQLWAHVIGELPPINNIGKVASASPTPTLSTLHSAVACYRGLKRPHDKESDGCSVLIYVLNPTVSIKFLPDMACLATPVNVPKNTVLTVQVRPDFTLQSSNVDINGVVTRLEFVSSANAEPTLPEGVDERYAELLWRT